MKVQRLAERRTPKRVEKRGQMRRFWEKTIHLPNGCIEWTACKNGWGYGVFVASSKRKYVLAHRFAWELAGKEIPTGKILMHTCDNPACVNVDHLVMGTQADNIADKVMKNRQAKGMRHGNAKLTELQVRGIREAIGTQRDIAKRFNISQATVHMIKSGKYWVGI